MDTYRTTKGRHARPSHPEMPESIYDIRWTFGGQEEYVPYHHSVGSKETLYPGGSKVLPTHKTLLQAKLSPLTLWWCSHSLVKHWTINSVVGHLRKSRDKR